MKHASPPANAKRAKHCEAVMNAVRIQREEIGDESERCQRGYTNPKRERGRIASQALLR
jgi:hypothetical protein